MIFQHILRSRCRSRNCTSSLLKVGLIQTLKIYVSPHFTCACLKGLLFRTEVMYFGQDYVSDAIERGTSLIC